MRWRTHCHGHLTFGFLRRVGDHDALSCTVYKYSSLVTPTTPLRTSTSQHRHSGIPMSPIITCSLFEPPLKNDDVCYYAEKDTVAQDFEKGTHFLLSETMSY